MSKLYRDAHDLEADSLPAPVGITPGKRTLTQSLAPQPMLFRFAESGIRRAAGQVTNERVAPCPAEPPVDYIDPFALHLYCDDVLAVERQAGPVMRATATGSGARDANGVAAGADMAVARASSSAGTPLPDELRGRFESSLGADLSGVRVHTGSASAEASAAVGAKAYTVGQDIHFGAGYYDPASSSGQLLLAHEVAHTVQQQGQAPSMQHKLEVSTPQDSAELEADRAAAAMVSGRTAVVSVATGGVVRRKEGTCSGAPTLRAWIEDATHIDDFRDLKYAVQDAEPTEENTRIITYRDERYTVSLAEADDLMELVEQRELEMLGYTPAEKGMSLDARVDTAIQSKDYTRMLELTAALDAAIEFYETPESDASSGWLVQLGDEEVRSDRTTVLAARKRLEAHTPSSIDARTPAGVKLENLTAGFRIAKNRTIADGLATGDDGTNVHISLTRGQLEIRFTPALETDYHGIPTAELHSVALIFLTGAISVDARGLTADMASEKVRSALTAMLAGSGFEKPRYDPYADQWLQVRLENLKSSVASGGGPKSADQVSAADLKGFHAGARLKMIEGVSHLDASKTGLVIAPGSVLEVGVSSGGTAEKGDLSTIRAVKVSANGATLYSEGEEVIRLQKLTLHHGGKVTLDGFELLGKAKEAGSWEAFLRLLGGAASLSSAGVPDDAAVNIAASEAQPKLVNGLAKHEVEAQLGAAIRGAIAANPDVHVGGKKLSEVLGL